MKSQLFTFIHFSFFYFYPDTTHNANNTLCRNEDVKIVNKYQCHVMVISHLQNFLDSLAINTLSNEAEITAYYAYFRTMKKVSQNIVLGVKIGDFGWSFLPFNRWLFLEAVKSNNGGSRLTVNCNRTQNVIGLMSCSV